MNRYPESSRQDTNGKKRRISPIIAFVCGVAVALLLLVLAIFLFLEWVDLSLRDPLSEP